MTRLDRWGLASCLGRTQTWIHFTWKWGTRLPFHGAKLLKAWISHLVQHLTALVESGVIIILCQVLLAPFRQLSLLWGLKRLFLTKSEFVLQFSTEVGSDGLRHISSSYRNYYNKWGLLHSDFLFSPPDYDDNLLFRGTSSAFLLLRGFCVGNWTKTWLAFQNSQVWNKHHQRREYFSLFKLHQL